MWCQKDVNSGPLGWCSGKTSLHTSGTEHTGPPGGCLKGWITPLLFCFWKHLWPFTQDTSVWRSCNKTCFFFDNWPWTCFLSPLWHSSWTHVTWMTSWDKPWWLVAMATTKTTSGSTAIFEPVQFSPAQFKLNVNLLFHLHTILRLSRAKSWKKPAQFYEFTGRTRFEFASFRVFVTLTGHLDFLSENKGEKKENYLPPILLILLAGSSQWLSFPGTFSEKQYKRWLDCVSHHFCWDTRKRSAVSPFKCHLYMSFFSLAHTDFVCLIPPPHATVHLSERLNESVVSVLRPSTRPCLGQNTWSHFFLPIFFSSPFFFINTTLSDESAHIHAGFFSWINI